MTTPLAVLGSAVGLLAVLALVGLRRRWLVVRVAGHSMMPTLRPGDVLLARRCHGDRLSTGDLVVFEAPGYDDGYEAMPDWSSGVLDRWLVKRVAAVPGDPVPADVAALLPSTPTVPPGTLVVLGDGAGYDSRTFGLVPFDRVLGTARRPLSITAPAG